MVMIMEYINVERDTSDGRDYDEKCYYGIIYSEDDVIRLDKAIFGKRDALRYYRDICLVAVKDKDTKDIKELQSPEHCFSLIKISTQLGKLYFENVNRNTQINIPIFLKVTRFGEIYGDTDTKSYGKEVNNMVGLSK